MQKAIKIRLYPTKWQAIGFSQITGCYRKIYNLCLEFSEKKHAETGKYITLSEASNYFHNKLRESKEFFYLKDENTKVLKQAIRNLMEAYSRYFKSLKGDIKGKRVGLPKKKKKKNYSKARFPKEAIAKKFITGEKQNQINLTKEFRKVKYRCSDTDKDYLIVNEANVKSVTIEKTCSGTYMASILIDSPDLPSQYRKHPIQDVSNTEGKIISLDLGIKTYVTTYNGNSCDKKDNPRFLDKRQKKLCRLQRNLSKKDIKNKKKKNTKEFVPSKNREKIRKKIAKTHSKIRNQKVDFMHCLSKKMINENQVVIVEDLNVAGMIKNHKLAKHLAQINLGEFVDILSYKAKWYNRTLIEVDCFFPSSKLCSNCNYKKNDLKLSDRNWICPICGTYHDRDENASKNLFKEGTRLYNEEQIGKRCPESKLADCAPMDDKAISNDCTLKSCHRMNQENTKINVISKEFH